ncbi:MaoC family dehydratase N-terminal domain-containing protein [Novosphingobium sp. ES2-1]|uniref:MaoC family dehydratase N-terminal domain-containing protein n=1 Tax=Novosphingobium sp. ES2-1 TaxID=2780074 RepID=UPI0018826E96|nr:MaoC family dehydratase N-terminal domain-containing protein [Novosphingobium sp. ES2-1]QOV96412.1 MaoC family dehydratase N-terminal domain-containing protein [Novosphingobium sp. ES2-1]
MTIAPDITGTLRCELQELLGQPLYRQVSDPVETGAIRLFAAAIGDAHPAWWMDEPECPPALLSAWNRPLMWQPCSGAQDSAQGLALHFQLKDMLGLPLAVVADSETEIGAPCRPGMRLGSTQTLVGIGPLRTNRLGSGRDWTLRVDYRCVASDLFLGAEILRFFAYGATA